MTKYMCYAQNVEPIAYEAEQRQVSSDWGGEYYVRLTDRTSEAGPAEDGYFVYEWNNALGKGKVRIPAHIIYDLPELLAILNAEARASGEAPYGIFATNKIVRIEEREIETLFQETSRVHQSN